MKAYVTATIEKLTGSNVHPDDTTLLARINNITVWSFSDEADLARFVDNRAGRDGWTADGQRVITVTTTPKEMKKIQSAGLYKG